MAERPQRTVGPPPTAATLHEAALGYLARYASTEAALRRVLDRRIERWARAASELHDRDNIAAATETARSAVRAVIAGLVAAGAVSDIAYAESRARGLVRAGRSHRAVVAHLAAKGVDVETARTALPPDAEMELAAALVLARRRRIGPFRTGEPADQAGQRRELAILARAGFPESLARRALAMPADEAEQLVTELRR